MFKMLHSRNEAQHDLTVKNSPMNLAKFEESIQYLREHGLTGLARHAMRSVMNSDAARDTQGNPKALTETAHQDSWSQFAISPGKSKSLHTLYGCPF